jgi:DNA-binding XRE family transcriptional regulator
LAERNRRIVEMLYHGVPEATAAREMGVSRQRIEQVIRQEYQRFTKRSANGRPGQYRSWLNDHGVAYMTLLRVIRGLKRVDVGRNLGLDYRTLCRIETGHAISADTAGILAKYLNAPLEDLFEKVS